MRYANSSSTLTFFMPNIISFSMYNMQKFLQKKSLGTIWNPANVCCVQFSPHSAYLLSFGCADNKIYCYDLRQTGVPWCTLTGHGKTVSYVKFLDSESLVSASTDNTLRLWDLKKASPDGLCPNACTLAFRGHTNEKVAYYNYI